MASVQNRMETVQKLIAGQHESIVAAVVAVVREVAAATVTTATDDAATAAHELRTFYGSKSDWLNGTLELRLWLCRGIPRPRRRGYQDWSAGARLIGGRLI